MFQGQCRQIYKSHGLFGTYFVCSIISNQWPVVLRDLPFVVFTFRKSPAVSEGSASRRQGTLDHQRFVLADSEELVRILQEAHRVIHIYPRDPVVPSQQVMCSTLLCRCVWRVQSYLLRRWQWIPRVLTRRFYFTVQRNDPKARPMAWPFHTNPDGTRGKQIASDLLSNGLWQTSPSSCPPKKSACWFSSLKRRPSQIMSSVFGLHLGSKQLTLT